MWQAVLFFVLLFFFYPHLLLHAFFWGFKAALLVWSATRNLWSAGHQALFRFYQWKKRVKRDFQIKVKTFDDRPVMQRPNLNTPLKKRF